MSFPTEPPIARAAKRWTSRGWWSLALVLGVATAGAGWMVRSRLADPTPPLTEESFTAALERWRTHGPKEYEIQIRVSGTQAATYRVVVESGEAKEAFRNDRPLLQKRTFETWSVPGMFSTIEADLTRLTEPPPGSAPPRLTLRAEFDREFGYPRRYRRIEWGKPTEVSWEVEKFVTQGK
jgi:Family of unknown function (DUF6174)